MLSGFELYYQYIIAKCMSYLSVIETFDTFN